MANKVEKKTNKLILRDFLIEIRRNSDLTQEQLSNKLNKPQSFISKYESGERRLDFLEFIEILQALNLDCIKSFSNLLKKLEKNNGK